MVVFRRIDHKRLWDRERDADEAWLSQAKARADALLDLLSEKNALSVYVVDGNTADSVRRIVVALAATRNSIDKFDFALLHDESIKRYGYTIRDLPGQTADRQVDAWHRDIVELSATAVGDLADLIQNESRISRIHERDVGRWIRRALESRILDESKVSEGVKVAAKRDRYRV